MILRGLIGAGGGLGVGGAVAALVVLTRFGPLVNTPRSWHAVILVAIFLVPAVAGGLLGVVSRRSRPDS